PRGGMTLTPARSAPRPRPRARTTGWRTVRGALDRARAGDEGAAQQAWSAICVSRWCEREGVDGARIARA
ncbi:MAG: hypothetical protein ACKORL_01630, partial [Phycisphaerales bacterium]